MREVRFDHTMVSLAARTLIIINVHYTEQSFSHLKLVVAQVEHLQRGRGGPAIWQPPRKLVLRQDDLLHRPQLPGSRQKRMQ